MLAFFVLIHMDMKQYYDLGQILSDNECNELAQEVLDLRIQGVVVEEKDTRFYRNSFGGATPGSWKILERTTPLVENLIGLKLKPENPYCRIYNNTSTLNRHIDRKGLDWTISVCLFTNLKHDWPLYAQIGEEILAFPTRFNTACLVNGGVVEHWRAPLQCADDEYTIQMFLHWSEA